MTAAPQAARTAPTPEPGSRYHLIEILRGCASVAVVFFHSLDRPSTGVPSGLAPFVNAATYGWLGVEVFFAISGWCIAERLAKAVRRGESVGHFLIERALRIYPTCWAVLVLMMGLRLLASRFNGMGASQPLPASIREGWAAFVLLDPYILRHAYLLVSWTLFFELSFYLCAAAALLPLARKWISGKALLVVAGVLSVIAARVSPFGQIGYLNYWPCFYVGIAAWWGCRRGHRTEGILAFGLFALSLSFASTSILPQYVTALVTAGILWAGYSHDTRLSALPGASWLKWLGGISYSLYLIHVPVVSPLHNLMRRFVLSRGWQGVAESAGCAAAAILAGWLLHRFIEAPVERWRRTL